MCGIIGFIGESKDPAVSHKLCTALLAKTETRGDDAAGFWATLKEKEENSAVYFSKRPIKSTAFIQTEMWNAWKNKPVDLMIGHCRKSTCRGSESINANNHPFVSLDYRTALVHNGNVPEFDSLKDNYEVRSDCDSEILLRLFEQGSLYEEDYVKNELQNLTINKKQKVKDLKTEEKLPAWVHGLCGFRDIFARISYGAMAVALAQRLEDGTRNLWLVRDRDRPLHVVDMRATLGQVYIVSERGIFRSAVESCPEVKKYCKGSTPIIEFPMMSVWLLTFKDGNFGIRKWKINRNRQAGTTFDEERPKEKRTVDYGEQPAVIMDLDFKEHKVLSAPKEQKPPVDNEEIEGEENDYEGAYEIDPKTGELIEINANENVILDDTVLENFDNADDLVANIDRSYAENIEYFDQKKTESKIEGFGAHSKKHGTSSSNNKIPLISNNGNTNPFFCDQAKSTTGTNPNFGTIAIPEIVIGKEGEPPNKSIISIEEENDYKPKRNLDLGVKSKLMLKKNKKPDVHELDEFHASVDNLKRILEQFDVEVQEYADQNLIDDNTIQSITQEIIEFTRQIEHTKNANEHCAMHG